MPAGAGWVLWQRFRKQDIKLNFTAIPAMERSSAWYLSGQTYLILMFWRRAAAKVDRCPARKLLGNLCAGSF